MPEQKLSRQKIILTASDSGLINKISPDSEHVHVLMDTRGGSFTVTLPTASATMQRELIFKNIGTLDATIKAQPGEYIDFDTSHVVSTLDLVSVWSDLKNTWWKLDANNATTGGGGSGSGAVFYSRTMAGPVNSTVEIASYDLVTTPFINLVLSIEQNSGDWQTAEQYHVTGTPNCTSGNWLLVPSANQNDDVAYSRTYALEMKCTVTTCTLRVRNVRVVT